MNYKARFHHLIQNHAEALLIEHPIDLLYLTGLELSAGKLLVHSKDCCLFVDGRYFEMCRKNSPCRVAPLDEHSIKNWLSSHALFSLAFDQERTSYQRFLQLQNMASELRNVSQNFYLLPKESPVQALRLIKDADEIVLLREAAQMAYEGYTFVAQNLKEGIMEAELALSLEFFWKKRGAKKLAFEPIIAFGINSSMPHYRAGTTQLKKGMSVLIDIGVVWQHYHSDMTRVLFFEGNSNPIMEQIFKIIQEAQQRALAISKPGTRIGDLDATARDWIHLHGYGPYFTHGLGHGLGLEIHEPPTLRANGAHKEMLLQPGMVITIEPGIYLPDIGGVRLEETVLITSEGHEILTAAAHSPS
jgi:Xaa-Pro aminopeptidase